MQISKEINQNHAKIQRSNECNGKVITSAKGGGAESERARREAEEERHFKSSLTHTASVHAYSL